MLLHDAVIVSNLLTKAHKTGTDQSDKLIRSDCDLVRIAGNVRMIGSSCQMNLRWSLDGKGRVLTIISQRGKGKRRVLHLSQCDGITTCRRIC